MSHFILPATTWDKHHYCPHFTGEKAEAHRISVDCPVSNLFAPITWALGMIPVVLPQEGVYYRRQEDFSESMDLRSMADLLNQSLGVSPSYVCFEKAP